MQILSPSNVVPFNTDAHVHKAAKLSTAEAKHLATVKARADEMNGISERCGKPRMGVRHPLDELIHVATVELTENPSAEAAEKVHALVARKHAAELSASTISACIKAAVRKEIDKLIPLALRILDDAEASFLAEAEEHRTVTKTQTTFASSTAEFDARLEATKAAFAEKRRWVAEEGAAAHYLILELAIGHA
jgi:hypothetical protein